MVGDVSTVATSEIAETSTPLAVARQVEAAYELRDWAALRALHHDDARVLTIGTGERVVGPDEFVDALVALEGTVFEVSETRTHPMDDDAELIGGQMRWPTAGGGIADAHRSAIMTLKDGLVWRSRVYRTDADARAAYVRYGIDLGI